MTGPRHNKSFLIRPESNMHVQKRRRSNTLVPRKMIMQKTRFSHDRHAFSIILDSGEDTKTINKCLWQNMSYCCISGPRGRAVKSAVS